MIDLKRWLSQKKEGLEVQTSSEYGANFNLLTNTCLDIIGEDQEACQKLCKDVADTFQQSLISVLEDYIERNNRKKDNSQSIGMQALLKEYGADVCGLSAWILQRLSVNYHD